MENYFFSIILGIIQGITEFVPVSSSGHLVVFESLFDFKWSDGIIFEVALHFGTLISLVVYFFSDIKKYFSGFIKNIGKNNRDFSVRLPMYVIIAMIPAIIAGAFWEDFFSSFYKPVSVAVLLLIGAVGFLIVEKYAKPEYKMKQMDWKQGLIIGLFQVLAFFPGMSRSGITIIAGMGVNLKRQSAARFTFLTAIPLIFAATFKQAIELAGLNLSVNDYLILALGVITSALSGFLTIKYLLKFLSSHTLRPFAYYRIILALLILVFSYK